MTPRCVTIKVSSSKTFNSQINLLILLYKSFNDSPSGKIVSTCTFLMKVLSTCFSFFLSKPLYIPLFCSLKDSKQSTSTFNILAIIKALSFALETSLEIILLILRLSFIQFAESLICFLPISVKKILLHPPI